MSERKILTIAIPTYNRSCLLERALKSILVQNNKKIEILVSDNCSIDNTEIMVNQYIKNNKNITYYKNDKNIGADKNFLQCYLKASGKFVMLLGSDDLFLKNSINHIVNFLESNGDMDWIFLNHAFFKNKFKDINDVVSFFKNDSGDFVTTDRKRFVLYASYQLTFMSCQILNKDKILAIDKPSKYFGTYFIHACIAFEITKNANACYGVITKYCIAQDQTPGQSGVDTDLSYIFLIFGKWMRYLFCKVAPQNGYEQHLMKKIYINRLCSYWPQMIITLKYEKEPTWRKAFWEYGFPATKDSVKSWYTIFIAAILPRFVANWIVKYIKPFIKKITKK